MKLWVIGAVAAAAVAFGVAPAWAGTISGTVTDAAMHGAPSDYVCVLALDPHGNAAGSAATDTLGNYSLSGLGAGSYRVEFVGDGGCIGTAGPYAFQYYPGVASPADARAVSVTAGGVTSGIDAAMRTGGGIAGASTPAPGGQALGAVCVQLLDLRGNFILQQPTDQRGSYDLEQLPVGRYKLTFVDDGCTGRTPQYAPQYFDAEATLARADPVTVSAGQTMSGIDATMEPIKPGGGRHRKPELLRFSSPRAGIGVNRQGVLTLKLRCVATYTCHVRIAITARISHGNGEHRRYTGKLIAATRLVIRAGRRRIALKLRHAGLRLLTASRAPKYLHAGVAITTTAGTSHTKTTTPVRLRLLS